MFVNISYVHQVGLLDLYASDLAAVLTYLQHSPATKKPHGFSFKNIILLTVIIHTLPLLSQIISEKSESFGHNWAVEGLVKPQVWKSPSPPSEAAINTTSQPKQKVRVKHSHHGSATQRAIFALIPL